MRLVTLCTCALLAASVVMAAPTDTRTPPPPNPRSDGLPRQATGTRGISGWIYVGESAPGFELTGADGRKVRLSSFAGERVLLCFSDRRELIPQYRLIADSLRRDGIRLVAIARDSPRTLKSLAERDSLEFGLLSDPTGEISATYGSYDFSTSSIRPGYVLVGRTGIVRMALLGQRLPPDDLLRISRYALIGL